MLAWVRWSVGAWCVACGGTAAATDAVDAGTTAEAGGATDARPPVIDVRVERGPVYPADGNYCGVPEPGPCCCQPFERGLIPHGAADGGSPCRWDIDVPAEVHVRPALLHLEMVPAPPDYPVFVGDASGCPTGWYLDDSTHPVVLHLCPETCQFFEETSGAIARIKQGCYTIACP